MSVRGGLCIPLVVVLVTVLACSSESDLPEFTGLSPQPSEAPSATRTPFVAPTMLPMPTVVSVPAGPNHVTAGGSTGYLHGANLPWVNWGCDFGCGLQSGVRSAQSQATLSATFATASEAGLRVIRWWMFPGEPTQLATGVGGSPGPVTEAVLADIDAAIAFANTYDLYFVFVLLSAPSHLPSSWLNDAEPRAALVSSLGAIFARYANEPRILAWEVVNEPEWELRAGTVAFPSVFALVEEVAAEVHRRSDAQVTVGSAFISELGIWVGAGLDFYQAHWYDPMGPADCARCISNADLRRVQRLDQPVVIGEFFADSTVDSIERYQDFYDLGYGGAWAWSLLPDRTMDQMAIDLDAARQFAQATSDTWP